MQLKEESQVNQALNTAKEELKDCNEDAADGAEPDCWSRESKVMRYSQAKEDFEPVTISEVQLGEEVMVVDP